MLHRVLRDLRRIQQPEGRLSAPCWRWPLRALQAPREGRWPGVRSPAHARGAPDGVCAAQCHQRQPSARRARTPLLGPPTVPRATCPGNRVARLLFACHHGLQQGGGGAPGRRPHSRCPGSSRAWLVMTQPAVVGLGGAPRAWAGERGRRRRPGAQSLAGWACAHRRLSLEAPGHLPWRDAWSARSGQRQQWAESGQRIAAVLTQLEPHRFRFIQRIHVALRTTTQPLIKPRSAPAAWAGSAPSTAAARTG